MAAGIAQLVTATAVVQAGPCAVSNIIIGVPSAGQTIKLHDCKTTGAAASGNELVRIATDTVGSYFIDARFAVGCVAVVSGGSPIATVVAGGS